MASKYRIAFVFLALILFFYSAHAQTERIERITPDGDTLILRAIPLSQITSSLETNYNQLKEITKNHENDPEVDIFDSIFEIKSLMLKEKRASYAEKRENFSPREISNNLIEWKSYEKMAAEWKELVKNHLLVIEADMFALDTLKQVWELTKKEVHKQKAPSDIIKSVSGMLTAINNEESSLKRLQNKMLERQNAISKEILAIDETISSLKKTENQLQSDYLAQDSPPIWRIQDSTLNAKTIKKHFHKAIIDNIQGVKLFVDSSQHTFYLHIFLFFLIWLAFYFLRKQAVILATEENEFELQQAHNAISRHLLSALVISMFLSVWLYPELNNTIGDILQLAYIVIAILFFPVYFDKKIRPVLYAILVLFLLDKVQIFFPSEMLFFRVVLLLKAFLSAWILYKFLNRKDSIYRELIRNKMGIVLFMMRLFFVFLILSVIGNILGILGLSILLCNVVSTAIVSLVIFLLVVIMLNRALVILLRIRFTRKSNYIKDHWQLVEKRLRTAIFLVALFLWLKSILKGFNFYDTISDWFVEIGQTSWKVGESTIEVSGVIDFFIVIILTYFVFRVLKTLLETELFPRVKLPRGVPGAISMIVGYVIVAYGIFLALAAAGVDLSEFGLMAGALGVGIGFGLQNIVANFIAGLILAFERPIQVGDTIEAGTVMGDVKHIGVRACTIRTFDGSEVMVPNGNLIANDVINWTLSDRKKRRDIFVSVAYGSNPHEVLEVLKKVGEENPNVLQVPAPWALFEGFGDSSLNFRLRIWTAMDVGLTTKSEVAMGIYDALNNAGIEIPFPQQDLHVKSFDPTVQEIILPGIKKNQKEK